MVYTRLLLHHTMLTENCFIVWVLLVRVMVSRVAPHLSSFVLIADWEEWMSVIFSQFFHSYLTFTLFVLLWQSQKWEGNGIIIMKTDSVAYEGGKYWGGENFNYLEGVWLIKYLTLTVDSLWYASCCIALPITNILWPLLEALWALSKPCKTYQLLGGSVPSCKILRGLDK